MRTPDLIWNSSCVDELRTALNALGLTADTAAAQEVMRTYSTTNPDRLNFDEFRLLVVKLRTFLEDVASEGD